MTVRKVITLINPNLLIQRNDIFTTGIVYMPVSLAYFASALRRSGFSCEVIDAFGERPNQYWKEGKFLFRGLTPADVVDRIHPDSILIFVYASNVSYHLSIVQIINSVRQRFPNKPVGVLENPNAVTAYSLRNLQKELFSLGVNYVITGESENRGIELAKTVFEDGLNGDTRKIDGVGHVKGGVMRYRPVENYINDLSSLTFPAWDMFPLRNYWRLKYAHGPFESRRYLPILTSRGCPYQCKFCVIPETNGGVWRSRTAENVVDEMEYLKTKYGVSEFHIEDVNPTISDKRIRMICKEIAKRDLIVTWKLCSGTKVETIKNVSTIKMMAEAGCRYISISPETGSPRILKLMNKPFDRAHAVQMIRKMNEVGIHSQACFVLGFPSETHQDRCMTWQLVRDLTRAGVDEIALFIIVPVPGSAIFDKFSGFRDYSQLTFSPEWRDDYDELNRFRFKLYQRFLIWKWFYHPKKIARQTFNFAMRRFKTKMEMTPYRALHCMLLETGIVGKKVTNEN